MKTSSLAIFIFVAGCFTCCMESGVRIYNVDPLVEKAHFGKLLAIILLLDLSFYILLVLNFYTFEKNTKVKLKKR